MALIDFILNVAGLLLWFNWRAVRFDPLARTAPATLTGTLRRAEPSRFKRWHLLAALGGLLLVRAVFYWQIGAAINWTANLDLGVISIPFRSDFIGRAFLFSFCSFGVVLAVFHFWLLFLSLLKPPTPEGNSPQRLVRQQLGRVDNWPGPVKAALPLVIATAAWWLLSWLLAHWAIVPRPGSEAQRIEQAVLIGVGSYLAWKYLIVGVLLLHVVNSYIYFGNHAFWSHVTVLSRRLLTPLQRLPLAVGKADFGPVLAIALVLVAAYFVEHGVKRPPLIEIPGLVDLYLKVSK